MSNETPERRLRSRDWFDNVERMDMTALYLERFMNYGVTPEELRSGKPIIGIAQTGSDLSPCNRHHIVLAERMREGIREMGGIAIEFPVHPIQETGKRPTAGLDRNLTYLGLVEALYGYPLDGVILTTGCDKTTPALLMAAATVNIPGTWCTASVGITRSVGSTPFTTCTRTVDFCHNQTIRVETASAGRITGIIAFAITTIAIKFITVQPYCNTCRSAVAII